MHFGFDDFVHLLRTDLICSWIWWHSLNELVLQMAQPLYIRSGIDLLASLNGLALLSMSYLYLWFKLVKHEFVWTSTQSSETI